MRILLGFMVGALSMLTFHQGMWEALHIMKIPKLLLPHAFALAPAEPWGLPRIANSCLFGGVFGSIFALLIPRFTFPLWFCGLLMGGVAAVINLRFFPDLTGSSRDTAWNIYNGMRMLLLDGAYGFGLGVLSPLFIHGSGGWSGFRHE